MKYYKIVGLMSLLVFSFYLTDFATDIAINSNPIMQVIKKSKNKYSCQSVNAVIKDNTIIPGIKGKIVNEMDSFLNMRDFGSFNSNYLVYDYIKPDISIEDNYDKVIISSNPSKRNISILINNNKEIYDYLKDNNINYTKLIKYDDSIDYSENINIESNKEKYLDLNTLLNKKNKLVNICLLDYSNIDVCIKKKYYIIKPNIILNNNLSKKLNEIKKGSIILISDELKLDNFKIFINYIKNKDLKIVYLSELIKE